MEPSEDGCRRPKQTIATPLAFEVAVIQTKEKSFPTASQPFIAEEPAECLLLVDNKGDRVTRRCSRHRKQIRNEPAEKNKLSPKTQSTNENSDIKEP